MYEKYLGIEISKVNNMMKRKCKNSSALEEHEDEITRKNGWIIGYLASNRDKDIFQKDIEYNFSIRRSTVSGILQLMEKKGYVNRESVSYDARLKKLTLTEKAWEYYNKAMVKVDESETMLRNDLNDEEIETFLRILDKIKHNIE